MERIEKYQWAIDTPRAGHVGTLGNGNF